MVADKGLEEKSVESMDVICNTKSNHYSGYFHAINFVARVSYHTVACSRRLVSETEQNRIVAME